ncbi:MAG: hypothetical protein ABR906_06525 [Terracidiphilus sp.]|jgi:hypothetical protein
MKVAWTFSIQNRAIKTISLLALLPCALSWAAWAASLPHTTRKTLDRPTEIQGYPCDKGYAWFFDDEHLSRCTVTREIPFGEARIPAGSYIALNPDGTPDLVQLSHDAPILDMNCMGGSLLGPSEGAMVAFYSSGKLKQCYLAGDQDVQGVPCMNGGFFGDGRGGGAQFHENGKLASCKLTKDFGGQHKGDRFVQKP